MALRTSVGTGAWSAPGTWDTGVPVDTDTFLIAAGHTVTFDVDQSAMGSGMGASTIAATGQLTIKDDGGTYYLKMNGNLTLNGTIQAGTSTSVPFTGTFKINYNAGAYTINAGTTGIINFYCKKPTYPWVRLSAQELSGQTILSVDTDVTTDEWNAGDTIYIVDSVGYDVQQTTLASTTATTVTVNDALDSNNEIGTYIINLTRNIVLYNTTSYALTSLQDSHIESQFDTCTYGVNAVQDTAFVGCSSLTCFRVPYQALNCTFDNCAFADSYTQGGWVNTWNDCFLSESTGTANTISQGYAEVFNDCHFAGNGYGDNSSNSPIFNRCYFSISAAALSNTKLPVLNDCVISDCTSVFSGVVGAVDNGTVTSGSVTRYLDISFGNKHYNCDFSAATTENLTYSTQYASQFAYEESINHDQVTNAYKAWTKGGIVTSQTGSPPTGYTIWYELACESASYPCFRQYETVVLPGGTIEVTGLMRNLDNGDLAGATIELQIIDKFADPLVDSTQNPLDSDAIAELNSAVESGWQTVDVVWANQGDAPRNVIVRMIVSGVVADIDTVWAIATYKEEITEILKRVKRISAGSEFT